jgi:hypothetical protein
MELKAQRQQALPVPDEVRAGRVGGQAPLTLKPGCRIQPRIPITREGRSLLARAVPILSRTHAELDPAAEHDSDRLRAALLALDRRKRPELPLW